MNNNTREFTLLRLKSLADEMAVISNEINVKLQRVGDISAELNVLSNSLQAMISTPSAGDSIMVNRVLKQRLTSGAYHLNGVKIRRGTIKDFVVQVLFDSGRGMTALDILAAINERFEKDYDRTSLSPQLSRLRQEGLLGLRGPTWYLITDNELSNRP